MMSLFLALIKGTSRFLEGLNRASGTDGSRLGKKSTNMKLLVSQKTIFIIISAERIVLVFFFFEDEMWCYSRLFYCFGVATVAPAFITSHKTGLITLSSMFLYAVKPVVHVFLC
jgi:hypothetical protein